MQIKTKSLPKPAPLIGITGLFLAASLSSSSRSSFSSSTTKMPTTSSSTKRTWPTTPYPPRHGRTWPYTLSDFTRQDPSPDTNFYSSPRFVTHIDDAAIATLREYYDDVLPRKGRILDWCSSWVSHYPATVEEAAGNGEVKVVGMGMNKAELEANKVLDAGRILQDLNLDPDIEKALLEANAIGPSEDELLDASTNVVSTDYLTSPVAVLTSLREATKWGGTVHLIISNRCFPTKAIRRWLQVDEEERVLMVGDFLHFAGWKEIEIVELSDGKVEAEQQALQGSLQGLMRFTGMGQRDPIWVVKGVKR